MKIAFAPQFLSINPYQKQLISALSELEVLVQGIPHNKIYLPKEVKNQESEVLHLHWLHEYSHSSNRYKSFLKALKFVCGLIKLKISSTKIVWTAHNLKAHENLFHISDRICTLAVALLADAIIAHSKVAKQEIANKLLGKNGKKISVIPHGNYFGYYKNIIDQETARHKINLPKSATVFLFFGLIRAYKGIPELIKAFNQLNAEDAYLLIVGNSRDKQLSNWIYLKSQENNRIRFYPGFVPDDDVQIYMNACDVVVLPYRNLLTSGAMILAMSFGRACIAPTIGCIPETLNDDTSFLYDPHKADGLFQAMSSSLNKKYACELMGKSNLVLAQENNWEKVAEMTLKVYQDCLVD